MADLIRARRRKVEKAFSEQTGPLIVGSLFGRVELAKADGFQDYADAYKELAWIYSAIFATATGAAIVPWDIWEGKPGESKKLEAGNPAVDLLENPNEDMTWFDLLEATISFLEISGDSYWEIARNKVGGKAKELFVTRPDRIKLIYRKDGHGVEAYRFKVKPYAKEHHDFPPKDMIHFFYFNPMDDWYGLSPLSAAAQSILSERYTIEYNQGFFQRDATPTGYLTTTESFTAQQGLEIARKWRNAMGGVSKSHKTVVLPKGLKYFPTGINPNDMQFLKQRRYNREEMLGVEGVPPAKVGLLEFCKYDTYQLQEAAFYRDTIQPKLLKVEGKITKFLRREFGKKLTFKFDLTDFLTADKNAQATRILKLFGVAGLTPNQVIERLNLGEPFEGGDERYVSSAYVPIGGEQVTAGERETAGAVEEMRRQVEEIKQAVANIDVEFKPSPDSEED